MAVILTAALLTPFPAHTGTELETWSQDWAQRSVNNLSVDLLVEWRDMHDRHPWYFDPKEVIATEYRPNVGAVATPPSANSGMGTGNVEQWRSLVAAYPLWDVERMLRIMACESGGNPDAYNGLTGVAGLFQIHPLWQSAWPGNYYDPWTNVAVAYQVWLEQGYGAWVCRG